MKGCRPFTDEEIGRLKAAIGSPRNRALLLLGVRSGFRISELLSLRVRDLIKNGAFVEEVTVARQYMKKKIESRSVPLHSEARSALEACIAGERDPERFVFKSRKGINRAISREQAWKILTSACRKCDLTGKTGTHSMRKTFAQRMYELLGKDLIATQEALGHRDVSSTGAYLSFDKKKIRDAILKS